MDHHMTINDILKKKSEKKKITALTAYDCPFARILDEAGVDIIMVGDSLGNAVLGYDTTLPVTMEEMLHHTKAVRRGVKNALLVGDMPFGSYQASLAECVGNAVRFIKEGGAAAVKLEGGRRVKEKIAALVEMGIPVMGHVGLTPQSYHQFGGYRIQGRDKKAALEVMKDAEAIQEAGAFSVVLEGIPAKLGKQITEKLAMPTIGIGAGPHCDGQVLVLHDILGLSGDFKPKFARRYADVEDITLKAVKEFTRDVQEGKFPSIDESFE
ncbi:MAG: 3-methyl-2-oxobutanoate hydroxymethyltransferase [Nitrospinae bacterium]|nr:3-methyl-2-oxobutanoate hydroxymethyltransferase [Nitrospinota bacterium]